MGEPGTTPPSASKRSRQIVALEEYYPVTVPTPAQQASRNIRRRSSCGSPAQDGMVSADAHEFLVYLPNATSVVVRVDATTCKNLRMTEFVELVKSEQSMNTDANSKQKQREITWKTGVYITDFQGNGIIDGRGVFTSLADEFKAGRGLLLHDGHPDTVHSHSDFWNVTPETHLLEILPQDYSVFSALADELDNSLQAVYQMESGTRLISVDLDHNNGMITIYDTGKGMDSTPQNSISKWGTMGSSMYRRLVNEAIGIPPPYLKPNFGMFGLGGIGAGLHLGGCISVSSKTKASPRVVVLHLAKQTLEANVKAGSVWKTGGEFRPPTEQELQWSPHGSFTKVEITNLNREIITWRVEEVQRKLKDFYFPYIQNDDGASGMTSRPVEIRVNGEDLAGVVGGEVALTNYFSGVGEPFVLFLEFIKSSPGGGYDRANARITCHYFPINKGREAIDEILEKLKKEDPRFMEPGVLGEVNFDNYSRRSIRRLGRLLPRARGGRLPFMEPKKFHRETEVNRHCYKRAKAFIDTDAGFVPTHSKTDLDPNHAFTEALLKLGSGVQTVDSASSGVVAVTVTRNGAVIKPEHLHADYKMWITRNHEKFDVGAVIDEFSAVIVSKPHHKEELNIKDVVFRVVYDIKCGDFNWKVGKNEAPIRLKLLKGLPGLNNMYIDTTVLYVTVECFISDGLADEPGQTRGETSIICRSLGVPEERGSREVVDENGEPTFILGESRAFPIEILFNSKCEVVDEAVWQRQEEKAQSKSPAFIEILSEQESFPNHVNLIAGAALPSEIIAVVRPKIWKDHMTGKLKGADSKRSQQKYIIAESMEMSLVVGKMKYHPPEVGFPADEMLKKVNEKIVSKVKKTYERKVSTSTGSIVKGLYYFSTKGNELEHIARTSGTYFLFFTLVSAKYKDVVPLVVRINVAPSPKIGKWTICSHPGNCSEHHQTHSPEMMRVRLGGKLPSKLYLSRFDEFGNPLKFEEIPRDITCEVYSKEGRPVNISTAVSTDLLMIPDEEHLHLEIPAIRIGQGNLEPLKPTMQAALRLIVAGNPVGSFSISVLPGRIASARMKESEALDNCLHPGQIIEKIIFEVLDSHRNPVSSDEQVKVVLEGFAFQDKVGHTRSVDGNGCLDLSMRLRITAGYGDEAGLELRSTADLTLWKKSFRVIYRSLRTKHVPDRVAFGSQLTGVEIEAVDANGQVDRTMDGAAHHLALDWNPNISVPLYRGVCTLPPIPMCNPGMWDGFVAHTQHSKLKTHISVWVDKPLRKSEREDYDPLASENPYAICQGPVASPDHYESKASVFRDAQAPADGDTLALEVALQSTIEKSKYLEGKLQRLGRKLKKQEDELERLAGMKEEHEKSMKQYQDDLDMLMAVNPGKIKPSGTGKSTVSDPGKSRISGPGKFKSSEPDKLRPGDHENNQILELYNPIMEVEDQVEAYSASTEDAPGMTLGFSTPAQVETQIAHLGHPPGTHAAAILLHAQRQQDRRIMDEVVGVVALLGAVENENINRALSAFLGLENMLAIICRTTRAAECFGIVNRDGSMDPNQGLYGLAHSRNLPISDRIRVITLADESSFYKRDDGRPTVIHSDPQKVLNMKPLIVSSRPVNVGSLGYAVNLIHLNEDQLRIRIAGRYGLRESLFFVLFGFLEVFDTTSNMLRAQKEIKSAAVSLDCGFIRSSNQFEWGARVDPEVWFPTWVSAAGQLNYNMRNLEVGAAATPAPPAPRRCIPFKEARPLQHKQRKELMKAMDATRQRYMDKGVEENIEKSIKQIQATKAKINAVSKLMNDNAERGFSLSRRVTGNKSTQ